jgi:hypothetical protein
MRLLTRLATACLVFNSFVFFGVADLATLASASPTNLTFYVNAAIDNASTFATDCASPTNTDCGVDDAINAFNTDATPGNADTIVFTSALNTFTVTNPTSIDNHTAGDSLSINGGGSNSTTVSGGGTNVVFTIVNVRTVSLSGLTIANGSSAQGAGVSSSYSNVTLSNDTFSNNAASNGGGVYNTYGAMTLSYDTFTNNTAAFGGGVFGDYNGSVNMTNDTFSNNAASSKGGGVYNNTSAAINMSNDTFSNNTAPIGGAVSTHGGATMINDTFFDSTLDSTGTTTIANSIVDGPSSCTGSLTDGGYNVESDNTCGFGLTSTVNSGSIGLATLLGVNGSSGPETLAIGPSSSAFNEVPLASCTVTTDERGFTRPGIIGDLCDAGAFETTPINSTLQLNGAAVAGNNAYSVTLTVPSGSPAPSGSVVIADSASNSCSAPLAQSTATIYTGSCGISSEAASDTVTATFNASLGDPVYRTATSNTLTVQAASVPVIGPVAASLTAQTITFGELADHRWGIPSFDVVATASSGLSVSFASETLLVCDVSGSTVSVLDAGTCTIIASQNGDHFFQPADSVTRSFNVTPVAPGIPTIRVISRPKGRLQISLDEPVTTGGRSITAYQASLDGRTWKKISMTSRDFVLTGLTPGVTYSVRLRAVNAVGASGASRVVRVRVK